MTDPWRVVLRRFAVDSRAPGVRSDTARRVFPLFLTDWAAPGTNGRAIVVSYTDYAQLLFACAGDARPQRRAVARAFHRLVLAGWLVEGPTVGLQHTYALGARALGSVACARVDRAA